jgi:hypothetical protein
MQYFLQVLKKTSMGADPSLWDVAIRGPFIMRIRSSFASDFAIF